jgi:mono/diheme cytochrome c family protein
MRNQQVTPKPGFIVCATLGLFLLSGGIGTMALADEAIPEGFKKGELAPEPPADVIEAGKRVYFTKCVWCHGVDGAGDGPGADRLWPRPRNFNQGTFKIRHTASGELPLYNYNERSPDSGKNDLLDTVTHGLPGSAMPPWEGILTEEQRVQVLAFVTTQLVKDRKFNDKATETQTILQLSTLNPVAQTEESIKKGAELVVEKKCIECHGVDGRGDGNAFNLKDDWGFSIQPADWHKCWNFRGTRQDPYNVRNIFRTFSTGLNGTPMPSFADNTTVEERWHIANFVGSLCERDVDGKTPLPIDPLTDKPKVNFVIPSAPIEGEISDDPANEMWQKQGRRIVAMGGQITHKPRNFVNRIDDIWVKSLYNEKNVVYLLQWDDRTKSVAEGKLKWAPIQVNVENFGVKEQAPKTGEEGSIASAQNNYAVYHDAIGMQWPIKWQEIPAPFKPRYLWGDARFNADIVKWEADGSLRSFRGTGWDQDFEERDDFEERMKLMKAEWKNGQWTVMISRPLGVKKDDYDEYTLFDVGQYIPTVFYAWDGHNGDAGRKMAVSAFYYTILQPPVPREVYIYPALIAFGVVILEGWVLTRRANKKKGKG